MQKFTAFLFAAGLIFFLLVWKYSASHATLPHMPLIIETQRGSVSLNVELATTPQQQDRGLMYRNSLARDAGMLFDFHAEQRVGFWMKNTPIPLDMIFIKANGSIVQIVPNAKPLSLDTVEAREPVRAVLEIAGGRASELGIMPGDRAVSPIFSDAFR